ncbi:MAG: hypothetical protein IIC52_09110 [Proteobacteria bacterium]|nr:hypothetical protein [Pseudomonadota bacterium]
MEQRKRFAGAAAIPMGVEVIMIDGVGGQQVADRPRSRPDACPEGGNARAGQPWVT